MQSQNAKVSQNTCFGRWTYDDRFVKKAPIFGGLGARQSNAAQAP
jgi:hypothetical protein